MAREMKESGIEWIGEIPKDWKISKYKFYASSRMGETILSSDTSEEKNEFNCIPIYSATQDDSIFGYMSNPNLVLHKNDFVIPARGNSIGCVTIIKDEIATCTQTTICSKNIHNIDIRFLYWCCGGLKDYWYKYDGSAIPQITVSQVNNNLLPLPPLSEQQAIADYLDKKCAEIDSVIEQTKATIEEYKKLKQSIITEVVTKGIRGDRPMKDSGIEWIGDIPAEWHRNSIKKVAITCSGGTPNSSDTTLYDGTINWICSYDLKEKPIYESIRKITQKGADSIAGKLQSVGSILVAMYGGAGTIGNSGILECEARTNQAICSIKFTNNHILDYYGFYYILAIRKYWMIYAVGTRKDPNISQDIVKNMPCIIPPIDEQNEIINYLDQKCAEIDTLIEKKTQLLEEMETLKKSIIFEYVTGKKEVTQ